MFFNKSKKLLTEANEQLSAKQQELDAAKITIEQLRNSYDAIVARYAPLIDKDTYLKGKEVQIQGAEQRLRELNGKYVAALSIHNKLETEITLYQDSLEIGSFGLYKRQFNIDTSEKFKDQIDKNYEEQKLAIKNDQAVACDKEWTVNGSVAEGKKKTNQYKKLMLFAFNGECDSLIAKVKWNNATKAEERINKAFDSVNKLGETHSIQITRVYLALKLRELALTYEYELKKYEEKEEQRRIREQMREEEKAQREMERAQKEAEDEERRFQKALDKAKEELGTASAMQVEGLNTQIKELEQKLQEAHDRKERAIAMAQLTKVGHIYVISNIGSFGENVYKIGMTRRLDPLDRVKELGDASVPFEFDIHAIIYSENAPQLEYELHQQFTNHRLNRINNKKEFFKVTLVEIEAFVNKHTNAEIQFTKLAEAREYRETLLMIEKLAQATETPKIESVYPVSLV